MLNKIEVILVFLILFCPALPSIADIQSTKRSTPSYALIVGSNIKGVEPANDFSYNSVIGLNNEGTIVMASSAASELSQESPRIQGSFFTHNFVVGLRGAADVNKDGRITF